MVRSILLWINLLGITGAMGQQSVLNVPYVDGGGAAQQMDLYLPDAKSFKSVIYIHEGSLLGGDKRDEPYEKIARKFQQDGIGFISINYRLGPENKWPSQPDDVCSAFAWLKKNISRYGGDEKEIFLAGHSSGALLSALVSTDPRYLNKTGYILEDIAGYIVIGSQLEAALPAVSKERLAAFFQTDNYLKIFGDTSVYKDACPMEHINPGMPPGLFIIAEAEQVNPPILSQTKDFIEKAKPVQADLRFVVTPNRTHRTNITKMPEDNDPVYQLLVDFVKTH